MKYTNLIKLPKEVKNILSKKIKGKTLDDLVRVLDLAKHDGKFGLKYSMSSSENYKHSKIASEVWKTKSGHCYELSLFLLACLDYLGFKANYCELPKFEEGDHASVGVKINKRFILLDPSCGAFDAKYKDYNILNRKQLVGNQYINCAAMFYHWDCDWKKHVGEKKMREYSRKSIKYAKLGLKYYPRSVRARELIKMNEKFLSNQTNSLIDH